MTPARRALPFEAWPDADRSMWDDLTSNGDILDGQGSFARLRLATVALRRKSYGFWLGFLIDRAVDLRAEPPAARATPDRLRAFLASLDGLSPGSQAQRVTSLCLILRAAAPDRDWSGLLRATARLQRIEARRSRQAHAAAGVSAARLAALGGELLAEAGRRSDLDATARAVRARDGAAIAMLAHLPLRIGNFAGLELGRSLIERGGVWAVRIAPEATKAGRPIEARLPPAASDAVQRYLDDHRGALVARRSGLAVWLTKTGAPYPAYKLSERIGEVTLGRLGVRVSAHRFRISTATTIAEAAPDRAAIIRPLLGHSTSKVADRAYNHAAMRSGVAAYQDALSAIAERRSAPGAEKVALEREESGRNRRLRRL